MIMDKKKQKRDPNGRSRWGQGIVIQKGLLQSL